MANERAARRGHQRNLHQWLDLQLPTNIAKDEQLPEGERLHQRCMRRFLPTPSASSNPSIKRLHHPNGHASLYVSGARTRDPALYDAPLEFPPMRFYSAPKTSTSTKEGTSKVDATKLLSSIVAGDLWFGVGPASVSREVVRQCPDQAGALSVVDGK
jgi:hypothetical protein